MEIIAEEKTKKILKPENSKGIVKIVSKNTITAEDGEKKDIISGKARLANNTTSNVLSDTELILTLLKGRDRHLSWLASLT